MTIVEFLEERIAEDEEAATTQVVQVFYEDDTFRVITGGPNHFTESDHRALREVDAKRKIVDGYKRSIRGMGGPATGPNTAPMLAATSKAVCDSIHSLAAIYSDHPDYRKEWATN